MNEVEPLCRRIKLIANPVAGGDALAKIRRVESCLAERGAQVETFLTSARGDAARAAVAAKAGGFDRLVVAGGDGTLNEVINGLVPSSIPLAFVPLGTTNVFALEVGIPVDVEAACRIALHGVPTSICLGRADEQRFLLMAGIGFDAEVVHGVDLGLKRRWGKLAYAVSAWRRFWQNPPAAIELILEDGRKMTGFGAIIGNGRLYGGRFSLTPGASLTEDAFEVCLLSRGGRWLEPAGAVLFKARDLTVSGARGRVQLDGDPCGPLPMRFRAVAGELSMILPGS
ncbi:MAG: diacylglycerol kinase family lipid kinase [Desulfuromonadaceae bacterium]